MKRMYIYLTGWLLTAILFFAQNLDYRKIKKEFETYQEIKKKVEKLEKKVITIELLLYKIKKMLIPIAYDTQSSTENF
ncbi:MAG: hypothetical protein ABIM49_03850 [candidate division WOR-3 bacterium]